MRENTKLEKFINGILTLVGLFFPVRFLNDLEKKWRVSISISGIPIGWVMVLISWIVKII